MPSSRNFVANVYSYVVTQRRTSNAGDVADSNIDLAAIFGAYGAHTISETKFRDNMERIFYTFVRSGALPPPDRYAGYNLQLMIHSAGPTLIPQI